MQNGFSRKTNNGVPFYTSAALESIGIVAHGFSTRIGGVSRGIFESLNLGRGVGTERENIIKNREIFCTALGVSPKNLRFARQEHGDGIFVVSRPDDLVPDGAGYDGFVTNLPGVPLMVFTADCLPLLLLDPVNRVAAAVHCGWRGTALGIAARAVGLMTERFGSLAEDIVAVMGPCIMPCHFLTDSDVPEAMISGLGEGASLFINPAGDKFSVDLPGINSHVLQRAGLTTENIFASGLCTACDTAEFFSHRIMGFDRGVCAGVISIL